MGSMITPEPSPSRCGMPWWKWKPGVSSSKKSSNGVPWNGLAPRRAAVLAWAWLRLGGGLDLHDGGNDLFGGRRETPGRASWRFSTPPALRPATTSAHRHGRPTARANRRTIRHSATAVDRRTRSAPENLNGPHPVRGVASHLQSTSHSALTRLAPTFTICIRSLFEIPDTALPVAAPGANAQPCHGFGTVAPTAPPRHVGVVRKLEGPCWQPVPPEVNYPLFF